MPSLFTVDDAFWSPRLATWRTVTVPHVMRQCEETGRLRNFDRAAGLLVDEFEGRVYDDSDVYKTLEGAAHVQARAPSAAVDLRAADWVSRIAAAQRPDGYLNTWHQTHADATPFEDLGARHELYCAGHLLEAGLARRAATGDEQLLEVARRYVELVGERFGPGGRREPPGHPELELALLRLHAAAGDADALALARRLLEARGETSGRTSFGEYAQDHLPLREQRQAVGHAVRALYLWSAVADLVAATGDTSWRPALDAVWKDLVETRMYVTGGLGNSAENEGFTAPYDLPDDSAYAETCAAIGLVFLAHRMSRLDGHARAIDVLERALFNGVLAGVSLEGNRFFYTNPLATPGGHERQPFFECACCPTNLARFLPAVEDLFATLTRDGVRLDVYAAGHVAFDRVALRIVTGYPWAGGVRVEVDVAGTRAFLLRLRIPGWCRGFAVARERGARRAARGAGVRGARPHVARGRHRRPRPGDARRARSGRRARGHGARTRGSPARSAGLLRGGRGPRRTRRRPGPPPHPSGRGGDPPAPPGRAHHAGRGGPARGPPPAPGGRALLRLAEPGRRVDAGVDRGDAGRPASRGGVMSRLPDPGVDRGKPGRPGHLSTARAAEARPSDGSAP